MCLLNTGNLRQSLKNMQWKVMARSLSWFLVGSRQPLNSRFKGLNTSTDHIWDDFPDGQSYHHESILTGFAFNISLFLTLRTFFLNPSMTVIPNRVGGCFFWILRPHYVQSFCLCCCLSVSFSHQTINALSGIVFYWFPCPQSNVINVP